MNAEHIELLPFACPHCGGPLHVPWPGMVECEVKHLFSTDEVLVEQARTSSKALWQAVAALRERAMTSRWMAEEVEEESPSRREVLERSAAADDHTVDVLLQQATALDALIQSSVTNRGSDGAATD